MAALLAELHGLRSDLAHRRLVGSENCAAKPLDMRAAAEFLGISLRHLVRLADTGRVKTILLGRRRMVPASEVARLAEQGTGE